MARPVIVRRTDGKAASTETLSRNGGRKTVRNAATTRRQERPDGRLIGERRSDTQFLFVYVSVETGEHENWHDTYYLYSALRFICYVSTALYLMMMTALSMIAHTLAAASGHKLLPIRFHLCVRFMGYIGVTAEVIKFLTFRKSNTDSDFGQCFLYT